ncbi:hypothetical protein GW17_00035443 [Ensete ventricosum]|nr:hypothetical protein GW17_00035443 [Ensete ventricosum]
MKDCVVSKLQWCKQNELQVCFDVGIILYPGGLFAAQGSYYLRMVNYVAPCLTALPTVTRFHEQFRNLEPIRDIGNNLQRLEQLIRDLSASLDEGATTSVGRCEACRSQRDTRHSTISSQRIYDAIMFQQFTAI